MALKRSDVTPTTEVELVSLCYKSDPLVTGQPGQLIQPGVYMAKDLPDGAFATGLVRRIASPVLVVDEEKPKATSSKPKVEVKPSVEDGK